MGLSKKMHREKFIRRIMKYGYSRRTAANWYKRTRRDYRLFGDQYSEEELKSAHDRGFLAKSIDAYNLNENKDLDYITDLQYLFLAPINSNYSKWIRDRLTVTRTLSDYKKYFNNIYFSLVPRDGEVLIFSTTETNDRPFTFDDIKKEILTGKCLLLTPSYWNTVRKKYEIIYKQDTLFINEEPSSFEDLEEIIQGLPAEYILTRVAVMAEFCEPSLTRRHYLQLYMTNDLDREDELLEALIYYRSDENGDIHLGDHQESDDDVVSAKDVEKIDKEIAEDEGWTDKTRRISDKPEDWEAGVNKRNGQADSAVEIVDIKDGSFVVDGVTHVIKHWEEIVKVAKSICTDMRQISFFTMSICITRNGFKIIHFNASPTLPPLLYGDKLRKYLLTRYDEKLSSYKYGRKELYEAIKTSRFHKFVKKKCRPGMRPYMQRLWFDAVKDDLRHTKGVSLKKKIWAWKHGFLSYRYWQYGLNEDNYKDFLSDYQYHWLNRINGMYQIWINDKTTFRFALSDFKKYIPDYYFVIFRRGSSRNMIRSMHDCPDDIPENFDGLIELLKREKQLALKPSAGTHGDGFYRIAYEDGKFYMNDDVVTEEEMRERIRNFHSFYLVTAFINMNKELKKIYPKSVNSVRIMVINRKGYNPKIMQSYMRIGSDATNYTDNVGRGGICVMVDVETGEMYQPETIANHIFTPCPVHPDTGVPVAGTIPNWELVKSELIRLCQSMPENEYLGFDIAITDDAFEIIEINIHQDLHKVDTHSDEIREYFRDKLKDKARRYGLEDY